LLAIAARQAGTRHSHPNIAESDSSPLVNAPTHLRDMNLEFSDEETAALLAELDRIIRDDRYPLSPRIRTLESDPREDQTRAGPRNLGRRRGHMRHRGRQQDRDAAKGAGRSKSPPGPPMTLGGAAGAGVRLIVWCKECQHQVEP